MPPVIPKSRADRLEQRIEAIESFREEYSGSHRNLMTSFASVKTDLDTALRDLAVCRSVNEQHEKRITTLETRFDNLDKQKHSSDTARDTEASEFKNCIRDFTHRLNMMEQRLTNDHQVVKRLNNMLGPQMAKAESLKDEKVVRQLLDAISHVSKPDPALPLTSKQNIDENADFESAELVSLPIKEDKPSDVENRAGPIPFRPLLSSKDLNTPRNSDNDSTKGLQVQEQSSTKGLRVDKAERFEPASSTIIKRKRSASIEHGNPSNAKAPCHQANLGRPKGTLPTG